MLKALTPLAAAVSLAWSGSATAANLTLFETWGTGTDAVVLAPGRTYEMYLSFSGIDVTSIYLEYNGSRVTRQWIDQIPPNGGYSDHDSPAPITCGVGPGCFELAAPGLYMATITTPADSFYPCGGTSPSSATCSQTHWWGAPLIDIRFTTDNSGDPPAATFSVTAIPEPATWALMIVGFSLVGATARRNRSRFRPV